MRRQVNESELIEIANLEATIARLQKEQQACEQKAQELMREERLSACCHAQKIFALKQKKLELKTEMLFHVRSLTRLRFEQ